MSPYCPTIDVASRYKKQGRHAWRCEQLFLPQYLLLTWASRLRGAVALREALASSIHGGGHRIWVLAAGGHDNTAPLCDVTEVPNLGGWWSSVATVTPSVRWRSALTATPSPPLASTRPPGCGMSPIPLIPSFWPHLPSTIPTMSTQSRRGQKGGGSSEWGAGRVVSGSGSVSGGGCEW
jgi:hypothetical protein